MSDSSSRCLEDRTFTGNTQTRTDQSLLASAAADNDTGFAAVVLAGGFGTRVRHLLPGIPKPMASVAGRPFLEWVVRYLAKQGVRNVVISTGYLGEIIEAHFAPQPVPGTTTRCVRESEPLGTAGGFLHAARSAEITPSSWLVLNGDSLCFADFAQVAADLNASETAGVITGYEVSDASRYGTLMVGSGGELLGFHEKRPGAGVINAGMYLFRSAVLSEFPTGAPLSFEHQVFPALAAKGVSLRVHLARGPFLDIGTPESLQAAETFVLSNQSQFA